MHEPLIKLLATEEGRKLECTSNKEKFELINNIIQLKLKIDNIFYKESIYVDLKTFIDCNIAAVKERSFGYDGIKLEQIKKYINKIGVEEGLAIAKYLERELRCHNFEDEIIDVSTMRKGIELKSIITRLKEVKNIPTNLFKLVMCAISYNFLTILATILIVIIIKLTVLLPAPSKSMILFNVSYENYFENGILNHITNVIASFANINNNFEVAPLSIWAFMLIIAGKLFIYIAIINLFFKEIERRVFK